MLIFLARRKLTLLISQLPFVDFKMSSWLFLYPEEHINYHVFFSSSSLPERVHYSKSTGSPENLDTGLNRRMNQSPNSSYFSGWNFD